MRIDKDILNQFISPDNSNRQKVEQLVQKVTTQLLVFLSTASDKATNPAIQYFDTSDFPIPDFSRTDNEIQANI